MNCTSKAAMENNVSLLNQCLTFGGFAKDAVYGFACASNIEKVNQSLSKEVPLPEKSNFISAAVNGYAFSDNKKQIYSLTNYRDYQSERAYGVSQAGRTAELNILLHHNRSLFSEAVRGYASTNQAEKLMPLIAGTNQYPIAIRAAAKNGHASLVNSILDRHLLDHATQSYCQGHHFEHAANLLERGANSTLALANLVDTHKQPNKAFYLMLLVHINDTTCFDKTIKSINLQAQSSPSLEISQQDISDISKIKSHMQENNCTFLHACIKNELISPAPSEADMTLITELMALSHRDVDSSPTSTPSI